jgi:hypothetical protein
MVDPGRCAAYVAPSRGGLQGNRVESLLYSLIESAKLSGVEPRAYLRDPTLRAVRDPGTLRLARDVKSPQS